MVSRDCRAKRRQGTFPKPNSQKERRFDPAKAAGPWKPRIEGPGEFRHATAACALRRSPTVMKKDPGVPLSNFR